MICVIDCGTTNTRLSIVNDEGGIAARAEKKIGVRDSAVSGNNKLLKEGLKELFESVLFKNGIKHEQIDVIVASGMITSELGLFELPHLTAPVGLHELSMGMRQFKDSERLLDIDIPIVLIPGVKNAGIDRSSIKNLGHVDFMRGEEVQCMALADRMKDILPINIVALSSHTKIIHITSEGKIAASTTTLSGQIYEALLSKTFIGKSVAGNDTNPVLPDRKNEIIEAAFETVRQTGLLRSFLLTRIMEILLDTTHSERNLFVNSIIAYDDMIAIDEFVKRGYFTDTYVFFGQENRCNLYERFFKEKYDGTIRIIKYYDKQILSDLTVEGILLVYNYKN